MRTRSLNHPLTRAPKQNARRGGVVVVVALSLMVLVGFMALVVDIGYQRVARTQIQMNAEAAAMAAGKELNGTDEGVENAIAAAQAFVEMNPVVGQTLTISSGDLQTGVWDGSDFHASTDASEVNSVRVSPKVEGVSAFMSKIAWGSDDLDMTGNATTKRDFGSAGGVSCYLPVAIPSCLLESYHDTTSVMTFDLKLAPSGIDSMGWARVGGSPSASWVRSQILNCEGDGEVRIGDEMGLDNGDKASALSALASEVSASTTTWNTDLFGTIPAKAGGSAISSSKYGNTFEAPVLVFEDDSYCIGSGGAFNGTQEISGFVWGAVYDVVTSGSDKTIRMRVNTMSDESYGTTGGGPDYGITYAGTPTFVQ